MTSCLVVDDSRVVRTLEKQILSELGYTQIAEAEDGEQAINYCQKKIPGLVLLDWHMPVMNGLEFLKQLRAMPGGDAPKVIFCTTESDLDKIMLALTAGADEYVMKPFDADIIKTKLQQVGFLE